MSTTGGWPLIRLRPFETGLFAFSYARNGSDCSRGCGMLAQPSTAYSESWFQIESNHACMLSTKTDPAEFGSLSFT